MKITQLSITLLSILLIFSCTKSEVKKEGMNIPKVYVRYISTPDAHQHPLGILEGTKDGLTVVFRLDKDSIDVRTKREDNSQNSDILNIYRTIMLELDELFGLTNFTSFRTGSFQDCGKPNWSIPVAIKSTKSELYIDYKKNYPNSTLKYLNRHYVDIANELYVYSELDVLFSEFGVKLELQYVEKVFTRKVSELSFKNELINEGLSLDTTVMYDAGIYTYSMIQSPK